MSRAEEIRRIKKGREEVVNAFCQRAVREGFRIFLAEKAFSNTSRYGFFTDQKGDRVVGFTIDLYRGVDLHGPWKPTRTHGAGWEITKGLSHSFVDFQRALNAEPPVELIPPGWKRTNLQKYLERYQKSSKFREIRSKHKPYYI